MKFRRIKHTLLRLSIEEKVTLFSSLAVMVGSFLPWYQVNLSVNGKKVIENGFSGDLGVIGFVVFIVTLIGLLTLVGEHMGFKMPTFGFAKERVVLFLSAQSAFLLLLTVAIYTKRSLEFTNAGIRFGLYTGLIGACLATFAAFALIQKLKRKETRAFFNQEEEEENQERMPMHFEEEEEPVNALSMEPEEETTSYETEPEMAEEEEEAPQTQMEDFMEEEVAEEPAVETEEDEGGVADQGNYFMQEAGVAKDEPGEEDAEEPKPKRKPSSGFYED